MRGGARAAAGRKRVVPAGEWPGGWWCRMHEQQLKGAGQGRTGVRVGVGNQQQQTGRKTGHSVPVNILQPPVSASTRAVDLPGCSRHDLATADACTPCALHPPPASSTSTSCRCLDTRLARRAPALHPAIPSCDLLPLRIAGTPVSPCRSRHTSGASFLLTGSLAAPLALSIVVIGWGQWGGACML